MTQLDQAQYRSRIDAENLAEIERIAGNPAAPDFDNTIAALERCGRTLSRVSAIYGVWSSTMSTADFQAVERDMQPKLAAFADRIYQNTALFVRIDALYGAMASLTPIRVEAPPQPGGPLAACRRRRPGLPQRAR